MNFSDQYHCFFVHIPKAAGTSIKLALDLPGRGHPPWTYLQQTFPRRWQNYLTFSVIRNPWDRFVSAYVYATMEESYWHGPEKGMHPDYELLSNMSFNELCERIIQGQVCLTHESWLPQYFWIGSTQGQGLSVDKVLRFENLSKEFNDLCQEIGARDCVLPRINGTKRDAYRSYYNSKSRELVGQLYRRDIEMFGYQF